MTEALDARCQLDEGATLNIIENRGRGTRSPTMPQGLPLFKPPYSRMTAIDLNTGDHVWMQPLGTGERLRNHPMLRELDLPPLGGDGSRSGPLVTPTMLIYALTTGGTAGGPQLLAVDKSTGVPRASVDIPRGAIGTPMTYLLDGRQYISILAGTTSDGPPRMSTFVLDGSAVIPSGK